MYFVVKGFFVFVWLGDGEIVDKFGVVIVGGNCG